MMNLCYRNGLIPGMPLTGQPEPAPMSANWQNNIPNNIPARPAPKALLMRQLEQAGFAVDDVSLFLDTHPDNQEALAYYREVSNLRANALNAYEQQYGPLFSEHVTAGQWDWVTETWPWEGEV